MPPGTRGVPRRLATSGNKNDSTPHSTRRGRHCCAAVCRVHARCVRTRATARPCCLRHPPLPNRAALAQEGSEPTEHLVISRCPAAPRAARGGGARGRGGKVLPLGITHHLLPADLVVAATHPTPPHTAPLPRLAPTLPTAAPATSSSFMPPAEHHLQLLPFSLLFTTLQCACHFTFRWPVLLPPVLATFYDARVPSFWTA